jgi:hypothetical protein
MIWHPLLLAVLILDVLSLVFMLSAAVTAGQIFLHWSPPSNGRGQIRLERRAESASVSAFFGLVFFGISGVLLVAAVTNLLPDLVPGAMCGTGVIQATRGLGARALGLRLLAALLFFYWGAFDRWNRSLPDQPLTPFNSRLLLLGMPFAILAMWDTVGAMRQLDTHHAVSCCAVVYDRLQGLVTSRSGALVSEQVRLTAFWAAAVGVFVGGWRAWRPAGPPGFGRALWLAVLVALWVPLAAMVTVRDLAAYHYQVLQHDCPWCLFLPEHHGVGFLLFGLLAGILFEGPLVLGAARVAVRFPDLEPVAGRRGKSAGLRVMLLLIAFIALAFWPAIVWRWRYGLWLG